MSILSKTKLFLLLFIGLLVTGCSTISPMLTSQADGGLKGDQLIRGQNFRLQTGETIYGQIIAIGSAINLDRGSMVEGNLTLIGSTLEANGVIQGDINIFSGSAHINNDAIVSGSINQFFNKTIVEPNAQVHGEINSFSLPGFPAAQITMVISGIVEFFQSGRWIFIELARILLMALLALGMIVIFKLPMRKMAAEIQSQPVVNWGVGLFVILAVLLISLILIITICLSPFGLIFLLALLISYLLGWLVLGYISGYLLNRWLKTNWSEILFTFIGTLILGIISILLSLIPCIGWLINFMIGCIGFGGVVSSRFGVLPRANISSTTLPSPEEKTKTSAVSLQEAGKVERPKSKTTKTKK